LLIIALAAPKLINGDNGDKKVMNRLWSIYRLPIAIFLAFMFVFLALFQSWMGTRATRNQASWVLHAALVISKTEEVLKDSGDLGSAVRRLVIVKENQPYRRLAASARQSLKANLQQLDRLIADNSIQRKRVDVLTVSVNLFIDKFDHLIGVYDIEGREKAFNLLQDDFGRSGLENIRRQASEILVAERQILESRSRNFESLIQNQSSLIILSMTGALVLTLVTIAVINNQLRRLLKSEETLSDLNKGLEQKVEDRVRDLVVVTEEIDIRRIQLELEKAKVELLLRDVNHSVGNNLAMVSSYLSLQANSQPNAEVKNIIERARERIHSIATAQRRLQFEEDFKSVDVQTTLGEVVKDLFESVGLHSNLNLKLKLAKISLAPRDVMSLSIILSELLTNALKYAYPTGATGVISISLQQAAQGLLLIVEDNGIGFEALSNDTASNGLGTTIISRIVNQYGGTVIWETVPTSGTRVTATLPKLLLTNSA
jgi:two-component sensor histidine kinase